MVGDLTIPAIFVISEDDQVSLPERVKLMHEKYSGRPKEIFVTKGDHAQERHGELIQRPLKFLQDVWMTAQPLDYQPDYPEVCIIKKAKKRQVVEFSPIKKVGDVPHSPEISFSGSDTDEWTRSTPFDKNSAERNNKNQHLRKKLPQWKNPFDLESEDYDFEVSPEDEQKGAWRGEGDGMDKTRQWKAEKFHTFKKPKFGDSGLGIQPFRVSKITRIGGGGKIGKNSGGGVKCPLLKDLYSVSPKPSIRADLK